MENKPRLALVFGFGGLLLLMLLVVTATLRQMDASQNRINALVTDKMAKVRLCNAMRDAARSRTVLLQKMILLDDPFEQDAQWLLYNRTADEFLRARHQFLALPLSQGERDLLALQAEYTHEGVRYQDQVVDLARTGRRLEARKLLMETVVPLQDKVLDALARIQALQETKAQAAVNEIERANHDARLLMAVLSALVLALGGGIATISLAANRRAQNALENERERALITLHTITDAVIRTDAHGVVEYLNAAAARMLDSSPAAVVSRPIQNVLKLVSDADDEVLDPVGRALREGMAWHAPPDQLSLLTGDRRVPAEAVIVPIQTPAGAVAGAVAVLRDMSEVRLLARKLTYQATHDALTGLLNRSEFDRCLHGAIERARADGKKAVFCYLDLDFFKIVNDSCGHVAGDEALRQVGSYIAAAVRSGDMVARVGGDEFGLLLSDCSVAKGMEIATEIKRAIHDRRFTWEKKSFEMGASIGMIEIDRDTPSVNEVYVIADDLCRRAKREGRDRIHMANGDFDREVRDITWIERIQRALAEDAFRLFGQWILPLNNSRGARGRAHIEILIRLREADGSIVSPLAFLPPAERYHLMPAIDRWVIRKTFALLQGDRGTARQSFCVNINLSGQSLCDKDFLSFVRSQFETTGVPPERVWFEITETAAVSNMTSAMALISALNGIGCNFALDDFGSGLSSFGYLKNLSVRQIKIDRLFVRDIAHDPVDRAMVRSINEMAQVMGIETVAEGIEDDEVREELEHIGVNYGQGYALARPQPLLTVIQSVRPRAGRTSIR